MSFDKEAGRLDTIPILKPRGFLFRASELWSRNYLLSATSFIESDPVP